MWEKMEQKSASLKTDELSEGKDVRIKVVS